MRDMTGYLKCRWLICLLFLNSRCFDFCFVAVLIIPEFHNSPQLYWININPPQIHWSIILVLFIRISKTVLIKSFTYHFLLCKNLYMRNITGYCWNVTIDWRVICLLFGFIGMLQIVAEYWKFDNILLPSHRWWTLGNRL
jgi:hypothetical protein